MKKNIAREGEHHDQSNLIRSHHWNHLWSYRILMPWLWHLFRQASHQNASNNEKSGWKMVDWNWMPVACAHDNHCDSKALKGETKCYIEWKMEPFWE